MLNKLVIIAGFLWLFAIADAAAYTVEEAKVRAWIQPNGDVTVNEVFHYSFTEYEEEVGRTLYREGHSGVDDFEAYAITGSNDEPGFIQSADLTMLDYEYGDETVWTTVDGEYETIKVFYTYTLEDAVRVYEEYTDAYLPFFSDGSHHDEDMNELYIDVIFPGPVPPDQTEVFFPDRNGEITHQDESGVRFYTPSSPMFTNSEVRILFPSDVMTEANPVPAPMSLNEAVQDQEAIYAEADKNFEQQSAIGSAVKWFNIFLIIAIILSVILMFIMRKRASGHAENVMNFTPLAVLFGQNEKPKQSESLLAALYTLKEKGALTTGMNSDHLTFQKSGQSVPLTKSEQFLLDTLFKTHDEVTLNESLLQEFSSQHYAKWEKLAKKEFNAQFGPNKRPLLLLRILMGLMFVLLVINHLLENSHPAAIFIFVFVPGILFALTFKFTLNKWLWMIAIFLNIFTGIALTDIGLNLTFLTYGLTLAVLVFLVKPLSFNYKKPQLEDSILSFKYMLTTDDSFSITKDAIDPWMIRAIQMPVHGVDLKDYIHQDHQPLKAVPLTYLVAKGVHPYEMMGEKSV
ncbi:hypothetical protein JMA_02070 [Jeotgalibacillus malaysiensis]|uniref:DUF2207 domain-containing protein n=1 Tax=Jeotgalibacillus malaysiensis TaxID=1508404 RepID=A0A0B5ANF2_9BACL|nr:DUF2207 domain-containing protein [Jeotgalibacillus malaysiensis]AJD89524.1 hypothetical protein JMA_02070 [Jeotgalibacillus malaysiensis]